MNVANSIKNNNLKSNIDLQNVHFFKKPNEKIYRFCFFSKSNGFVLFLHNRSLYLTSELAPHQNFMIRYYSEKNLDDYIKNGATLQNTNLSFDNNLYALSRCTNLKNINNINFDYTTFRNLGSKIFKLQKEKLSLQELLSLEEEFVTMQKQFLNSKKQQKIEKN